MAAAGIGRRLRSTAGEVHRDVVRSHRPAGGNSLCDTPQAAVASGLSVKCNKGSTLPAAGGKSPITDCSSIDCASRVCGVRERTLQEEPSQEIAAE